MPDDKKESGMLGQIVMAVVVALLASGTSPWWWDKVFKPSAPIVSPTSQSSPEINIQTLQEQPSSSQEQSTSSTETDTKNENNQGLHLQPGDYCFAVAYSIGVF